jgi:hypothetical protein
MRLFAVLIFVITFAAARSIAQQSDIYVISSFVVPSAVKEKDIDKYKPTEVAKVDISKVTEGTRLSRTFRVQGTRLWTYVEIFFDDDMKYYDSLYDAMTVDVVFSTARKRTKYNIVGIATSQSAFDENFRQVDTVGYAKLPGKRIGVVVSCRGKKPKDE